MKKLFVYLILSVIIFSGCQKSLVDIDPQKESKHFKNFGTFQNLYNIQNGILVFKTEDDMFKVLNVLMQMTPQEYDKWCDENNFMSLEKIYRDAINSQADLNEKFEELETNNSNFSRTQKYSEKLNNCIENGLIIDITKKGGFEEYQLATCRRELAFVLNSEKLVSINGDIYQYNKEDIKIIKNNNFSEINNLKTITESNENVIIWKPKEEPVDNIKYMYNYPDNIYYLNQYLKQYDSKRTVKITLEAYNRVFTINGINDGNHRLVFYTSIKHYKNTSLNKTYKMKIRQGTNFEVRECTKQFNIEILDRFNLVDDFVVNDQTELTYYLIGGSYPRLVTDNTVNLFIIHLPHLYKGGTIKYFVQDKYWTLHGYVYPTLNYEYSIDREQFLCF